MIIAIASPSASGKTTLVTQAVERFNLTRLVTTTTRQKRASETNDDYHFVSPDEFTCILNADGFVEHNQVYCNWYGLEKIEVESKLDRKCIIIQDVGGVKTLKKLYGDKVATIFIMPPSIEELKNRIKMRGENDPDDTACRLAEVDREIGESSWFDYIVVNDDLEQARAEFNEVISRIICPIFN